jgi:hypothetical protein
MSEEGNKAVYGVDIQRYNYMVLKAEEMGFKVVVKYEGFELYKGERYYGLFFVVSEILSYISGFEVGKSEGKCEAINEYMSGDNNSKPDADIH